MSTSTMGRASRRMERSRPASTVAALLCALVGMLAYGSTPALAGGAGETSCPTEAPRNNMADCRVYEQVSPEFKGGYGALAIEDVQAEGEGVVYASFGIFAGSSSTTFAHYYHADRTSGLGWGSTALNPPAAVSPNASSAGFSPSLEASLWSYALHSKNQGTANDVSTEDQLHLGVRGEFRGVGPVFKAQNGEPFEFLEVGISADLCHVVVESPALVPEAVGASEQLYDLDTCDPGVLAPQMVAVANDGKLFWSGHCSPQLGSFTRTDAVSADGKTIFFGLTNGPPCEVENYQLFARVGGEHTLEISKPLGESEPCTEVPCPDAGVRAGAIFQGASEDGSRVFFTTSASLDPATDMDNGNDLYMAVIGCPPPAGECESGQRVVTSLVQVSHDPNVGEAAGVRGVVGVSRDGSHVYFVARGLLSSQGPSVEGAQLSPVEGADNLYSYGRDAQYPGGT